MAESFDNIKIDKRYANKKKANIERAMAGGVDSIIEYLTNKSKLFNKNEVKAIALLKDDPFLKDEVANILLLSVHMKGWITNMLYKFWIPFTKAFQTIYYNKRVQKALKRLNFGGGGGGDW